ncbi:MAG: hypothetical protein D6677_02025 [Calditrichaeota bacterium]|nr:MAG: hypothetical protein D6677_02025 [Calditrichota bacterium]
MGSRSARSSQPANSNAAHARAKRRRRRTKGKNRWRARRSLRYKAPMAVAGKTRDGVKRYRGPTIFLPAFSGNKRRKSGCGARRYIITTHVKRTAQNGMKRIPSGAKRA